MAQQTLNNVELGLDFRTKLNDNFTELYSIKASLSGATFTGDVTVPNLITSGNVDGRDVSVDGAKLDGIESGATADQVASEVVSTPAGNLVATDVQGALNELDTEKAALSDSAFTGLLSPPIVTTTERDAIPTPRQFLIVGNSTTSKLNFYNGSSWEEVTSA